MVGVLWILGYSQGRPTAAFFSWQTAHGTVHWPRFVIADSFTSRQTSMVAEITDSDKKTDRPQQPKACGTGQGGCCQCQQVIKDLSCGQQADQTVPIKEVLLVFFLPLVCAAAAVIWAVHSWPALAGHPGYLALAALAVAVGALAVARVITNTRTNRSEANQTQK